MSAVGSSLFHWCSSESYLKFCWTVIFHDAGKLPLTCISSSPCSQVARWNTPVPVWDPPDTDSPRWPQKPYTGAARLLSCWSRMRPSCWVTGRWWAQGGCWRGAGASALPDSTWVRWGRAEHSPAAASKANYVSPACRCCAGRASAPRALIWKCQ